MLLTQTWRKRNGPILEVYEAAKARDLLFPREKLTIVEDTCTGNVLPPANRTLHSE